ncbi:MAG: hypothetical protein ACRCTI_21050 [Beijerinckiaceae bacterium]
MSRMVIRRLLREWVALLAILAVVLGPLALATSRSLGAAEKIAIASGASPPALCLPGGPMHDAGGGTGASDCDHCTPVQPCVPASGGAAASFAIGAASGPKPAGAVCGSAFPRAPPARGPPSA